MRRIVRVLRWQLKLTVATAQLITAYGNQFRL